MLAAWTLASPAQRQSFRTWIATQPDDESPVSPTMRELATKDEAVALAAQRREQALGSPAKHDSAGRVTQLPRPPSPIALIAEMARRNLPGALEGRRAARDAARAVARKPTPSGTPKGEAS